MPLVARLGSLSSHGGVLIAPVAKDIEAGDIPVAHVGTLHACPIFGHGVTPVTTGISSVKAGGPPIATVGSVCGCGAVVVTGAGDVEAG